MSFGDCIGKNFGMLTILDEFHKENTNKPIYCKCKCSCGNEKIILKSNIIHNKSKSCGCVSKKYNDINIGDVFSRLKVIEKSNRTDKYYGKYWLCQCECGNIVEVKDIRLKEGHTKSCGCLQKETMLKNISNNKKYNTYDLSGDYGIGYTTKGEEFYFDIEDYNLIKNICWNIGKQGYVCHIDNQNNKTIFMHRIIMNITNNNYKLEQIDHINHIKNDNRKENLRICNCQKNVINRRIMKNNTSGAIGVYLVKETMKWRAIIIYNKKHINLGRYKNKEDAIIARLKAEKEYFGEFAPQRDLFEKYGIE